MPTETEVACIGSGKTAKITSGTAIAGVVEGEGSVYLSTTLTVASETEASTIGGFAVAGGTLKGAGTLKVSGSLTVTGETKWQGKGSTVVLPGATAELTPSTYMRVEGRRFVNEGNVTLNPTEGEVLVNEGAEIANSGTLSLEKAEKLVAFGVYGTGGTFVNTGTFQKTAGTGTSTVEINFENKGSIEAKSGNFTFAKGGSTSGANSWTAAEGKKIVFGGGTFSMGSSTTWSGDFEFNATVTAEGLSDPGGKLTVAGSLTVNGPLATKTVILKSGTLTLNGEEPSTAATVQQSGGTLTGTGTLEVTGSLSTSGSNITMSGSGKTVIKPEASATFQQESNGASITLDKRKLLNEGTATFTTGNFYMWNAARIENSGTFKANAEPTNVPAIRRGPGSEQLIVNTGNFEKTAGTGKTEVDVKFENKGTAELKSGTLDFAEGGSASGASYWTAAEGRTLVFGSGTFSMGSSTTWSGDFEFNATVAAEGLSDPGGKLTVGGTLTINGPLATKTVALKSGTLTLNGEEPSTITTFTQTGGTLTGAGTLNVTSSLTTGGTNVTMSGSGKTVIKPEASATFQQEVSGGSITLDKRKLLNEGTATLTLGNIYMWNAARIENAGTFKANAEPTSVPAIRRGTGSEQLIVNTGSFEKTAGTGKTEVDVSLENKGSIELKSGNFTFAEGGSTSGANSWTAAEGKKIVFGGGTFSMGSSTTWSGDFEATTGTVTASAGLSDPGSKLTVSGGTLNVNGGPLETGTLVGSGGTVSLGSATEASTVSTFTLTGGTLTGAGTLNVTSSLTTGGTNVTMSGSGKTVIKPGASATFQQEVSGGSITIDKRTLLNEGTATLTLGNLYMWNAARIENQGTFKANAEPTSVPAIRRGPGSEQLIVNTGSFEKTAGTGKTVVDVDFANLGTVGNKEGALEIKRPVHIDIETSKRAECADPVDCATGDFFESQTDLAVGGLGVGLTLTRTYSAQAAAIASSPGAFGYGWSHSFGERLVSEESGKKVTLIAANGTKVPFTGGPSVFTAPAWSQQALTGTAETGYVLTQADQAEFAFSGTGRLESVTDRNGNATTLSYNGLGRLTAVTDPAGREMKLTYNGGGQVESVKDPMGHQIKYAYESGHLAKVTMPGEESPRWQFKYDGSHRMTTMTDGRGGKTTNEYDGSSRVKSQTDPAGRTYSFEYEPFHTKVTNQTTKTATDQWFTSYNQPFSVTYAFGTASARTETFGYDAAGRLASQTDPAGRTTTFTYNAAGDRTSVKDPAKNETKWTYNGTHDVLTMTAPGGLTTTIARDEAGNPESISRPAPGGGTQTTSFEYNEDGQLEGLTDPLERTWEYGYNENGDLTAESNPEGETRTWVYDGNSQITAVVSPRGNEEGAEASEFTTTTTRDDQGRVIDITDPLGHSVEYGYDGNGNVDEKTDPNGHTTTYFYNAVNEPIKTEEPNGDTTEAAYDGEGQVISQTNGNEDTTSYVRNVLGQVVEVVDPLERKRSYEYDLAGNLETVIDQAERETTYGYDDADRVTEIDYSSAGTADVSLEYDADGNVIEMVDGSGESSFEYDGLGRLTKSADGHGDIVEYAYNLASEQIGITYPNGKSVSRSFDEAGRLTSVSDWLEGTTTFSYDADSNLEEILFPAGTGRADEFSYDPAGQVSDVTFEDGGEPLAAIGYTRDKAAQIEATATEGLPGPEEQEFGYDENGRLVESSAGSYEFDPAGYLVETPTASNLFNAAGELEEGGGVSYDYNALGERIEAAPESGPPTTYDYDQAGGLTSVQRTAEGEVPALSEEFTYDGTRLATSHSSGGSTRYLSWDVSGGPPLLLAEAGVSYIYGPGGLPIARIDSEESPIYYHRDQLGSTRMLSDGAGESVASFSFEPYGALEASTGAAKTPFGYAGQYTASGSGFQYLRARFYDPSTAQFLTEDPLSSITGEPYGYGAGNPLSYVDRTGLGPCLGGVLFCDEEDDPCDSVMSGPMLALCLVPDEAAPTVTNISAGVGDSILSKVPGTDPGPWLRDLLDINNVSECSAAYRFSRGIAEWIQITKGITNGTETVGRHLPDIIKGGREMSRRQRERWVHLPPEIMP